MKTNLQLFGGRGGGSGLSGGGGSSGQTGDRNAPAAQQYRKDVAELANANMSNSDLQAAVEAYAMTHKGVDEDEMLRNVREYKDFANHPDVLSPAARTMLEDAGLNLGQTTQKTFISGKDAMPAYNERINKAKSITELNNIIEEAANATNRAGDDLFTNAQYEKLYAKALRKIQNYGG